MLSFEKLTEQTLETVNKLLELKESVEVFVCSKDELFKLDIFVDDLIKDGYNWVTKPCVKNWTYDSTPFNKFNYTAIIVHPKSKVISHTMFDDLMKSTFWFINNVIRITLVK